MNDFFAVCYAITLGGVGVCFLAAAIFILLKIHVRNEGITIKAINVVQQ